MTVWKPLAEWQCDFCGERIKEPDHGYLEWLAEEFDRVHDFRIVHHAPHSPRGPSDNCYHHAGKRGHADVDLPKVIGPNGIAYLLSFLDLGAYHSGESEGPRVDSIREWVEIYRRLHLPHYEQARLFWDNAIEDGHFSGANEVAIYSQRSLLELIRRYA